MVLINVSIQETSGISKEEKYWTSSFTREELNKGFQVFKIHLNGPEPLQIQM